MSPIHFLMAKAKNGQFDVAESDAMLAGEVKRRVAPELHTFENIARHAKYGLDTV